MPGTGPFPDPAEWDPASPSIDLWFEKVRVHAEDSYCGLSMLKMPEDLRMYEHIIWESRSDTVIEIGSRTGASALWFAHRLSSFQRHANPSRGHKVVTVDVSNEAVQSLLPFNPESLGISCVVGNAAESDTIFAVRKLVGSGRRCLVSEDSAHDYPTTLAVLQNYSEFVPIGGYFVVEDTCVDDDALRIEGWSRGVVQAIDEWLKSNQGSAFRRCDHLPIYGTSCNRGGYLQRISE